MTEAKTEFSQIFSIAVSLLLISSLLTPLAVGKAAALNREVVIDNSASDPSPGDDDYSEDLNGGQKYDFNLKIDYRLADGEKGTLKLYFPDTQGLVAEKTVTGSGEYKTAKVNLSETVSKDLIGESFDVSVTLEDESGNLHLDDASYDVIAPGEPPTIKSASPSGDTIAVENGDTQQFSVEASDPDEDDISYTWYYRKSLSGEYSKVGTGKSYSHTFDQKLDSGDETPQIKVEVEDQYHVVKRDWLIDLNKENKDRSPSIERLSPSSQEIGIEAGETKEFKVEVSDQDADLEKLEWYVDSERQEKFTGFGDTTSRNLGFNHTFDSGGSHTIRVKITDSNGNTAELLWGTKQPDLTVTNVEWRPESPTPGDTVEFRVTVKNTGAVQAKTVNMGVYRDGSVIATPPTITLSAGESYTSPWIGNWALPETGVQIDAVADKEDNLHESDENNNRITAKVPKKTDSGYRTEITNFDYSFAGTDADTRGVPGATHTLNYSWTESGGEGVLYLESGAALGAGDASTTGITTVGTTWTAPSDGSYQIRAEYDLNGTIKHKHVPKGWWTFPIKAFGGVGAVTEVTTSVTVYDTTTNTEVTEWECGEHTGKSPSAAAELVDTAVNVITTLTLGTGKIAAKFAPKLAAKTGISQGTAKLVLQQAGDAGVDILADQAVNQVFKGNVNTSIEPTCGVGVVSFDAESGHKYNLNFNTRASTATLGFALGGSYANVSVRSNVDSMIVKSTTTTISPPTITVKRAPPRYISQSDQMKATFEISNNGIPMEISYRLHIGNRTTAWSDWKQQDTTAVTRSVSDFDPSLTDKEGTYTIEMRARTSATQAISSSAATTFTLVKNPPTIDLTVVKINDTARKIHPTIETPATTQSIEFEYRNGNGNWRDWQTITQAKSIIFKTSEFDAIRARATDVTGQTSDWTKTTIANTDPVEPAHFNVSLQNVPDSTPAGTEINVTALVTNTGEMEDIQPIEFVVNDEIQNVITKQLEPEEKTQITFTYPTDSKRTKNLPLYVRTEDSSATATVEIGDDDSSEPTSPPIISDISWTPSDPTTDDKIEFAATAPDPDNSISQYQWDFNDDGQPEATGSTVTHSFNTPGEYTITLTVTDATGQSNSTTTTITVNAPTDSDSITTDTFEDGNLVEYRDVESARLTTNTAYHGKYALVITDRNEEMFKQNGHYTGNKIRRVIQASQPTQLSAAVRIDDGIYNDLRLYWRNASGHAVVGINFDVWRGKFRYNGTNIADIQPYTWYNVKFVGIDWTTQTVDRILVNDEVVARDVGFLNDASDLHQISMSVNDAGTGSKVWFDNVSLSTEGSKIPRAGGRLSFETGTVGKSKLPYPWVVRSDGGVASVSTDNAGHGDFAMRVRGSSSLGTSEVAVTVNLTGVEEIRYDTYIDRTDTGAGEIYTSIVRPRAGGQKTKLNGFTLKGTNVWHNDTTADVSTYTGRWELVFHARGNNNGGYFDNIRFYDAENNQLPVGEVVTNLESTTETTPSASVFDNFETTSSVGWTIESGAESTLSFSRDAVQGSHSLYFQNAPTSVTITKPFKDPMKIRTFRLWFKYSSQEDNNFRYTLRDSDGKVLIEIREFFQIVHYKNHGGSGVTAQDVADISQEKWYQVVLTNIDYQTQTLDVIVKDHDGNMIGSVTDVDFWEDVTHVDRVRLTNGLEAVPGPGAATDPLWIDNITYTGSTIENNDDPSPGSDTTHISFEKSPVGNTTPVNPWYLAKDAGTHEISDTVSTHGSQSLHLSGSSGLGQTWANLDVNLTGVATIKGDIYPVKTATSFGDIKVHIDNINGKVMGATQKQPNQWHRNLSGDVSNYKGEHTLILRTRGANNEAYFDNIRFYNADGDRLPLSQVIPSRSAANDSPNIPTITEISWSSTNVTPNTPIDFTARASDPDGKITSYEWDFTGDGQIDATGKTVSHNFNTAGDYQVTLTVTDETGTTNSLTRTLTVNESKVTDNPSINSSLFDGFETPDQLGWTVSKGAESTLSFSRDAVQGTHSLYFQNAPNSVTITKSFETPTKVRTFRLWFKYQSQNDNNFRYTLRGTDDNVLIEIREFFRTLHYKNEGGQGVTARDVADISMNTWYQVVLSNIDYQSQTLDIAVKNRDGTVVGSVSDVQFRENVSSVARVRLTNSLESQPGPGGATDPLWIDNVTYTYQPNEQDDVTAPPIVSNISWTPSNLTISDQIEFTAQASDPDGTITKYEWDFTDDGQPDATGTTVTHSFDAPGEYPITLTVTDDTGMTNTSTATITITEPSQPSSDLSLSVSDTSVEQSATTAPVSVTVENTASTVVELPAVTLTDLPAGWSIDRVETDSGSPSTDQSQIIYNEIAANSQRTPVWTLSVPADTTPGNYTVTINTKHGGDLVQSRTATITIEKPGITIGFVPERMNQRPENTITTAVTIREFDRSVGSYQFNVSVNETSVATINDIELVGASSDDLGVNVGIARDGSRATVRVPRGDHDAGTIARVTLTTKSAGGAELTIHDPLVSDRNFTEYPIAETTTAILRVDESTAPPPVIGTTQPTDPDSDGQFEDITGDGRVNILDVGAFLQSRQNNTVQNNIEAFDFTGDGTVNILDVGKLLQQVVGS